MFERFTDRARRAVVEAQNASREMLHDYIGTEHLLFGILRDSESEGAKVLNALGVTIEEATARTVKHVRGAARHTTPPAHVLFTPRAKKALEVALREALALGVNYIATEHILLGILRDDESVGSVVLKEFGVDYKSALQQHVNPPDQSATAGDRRVRVTRLGNTITLTINADAFVLVDGYAFGSEQYILKAKDKHVITIELADLKDSDSASSVNDGQPEPTVQPAD